MLRKALQMVVYGAMLSSLLVFDHLLGNGFTDILLTGYCKMFCFVKIITYIAWSLRTGDIEVLQIVVYGAMLGSLLVFDHLLGNGFTDILLMSYWKRNLFLKKTLREQANRYQVAEKKDLNVMVLFFEIAVLCCTMMILNKYKKYRLDCIDKDINSEKNQHLEKITFHHQINRSWNGDTTSIRTLDLETLDPTRNQAERGDEGDIYSAITDAAISPISTLLLECISEDSIDVDESNSVQFNNDRYLWDVIEEE